jgi:tetratricopeptide (TPR) repeat protein
MKNRWIGIIFTLLFIGFLAFAARRISAPLLDFHSFHLESKLIYVILASISVGGLLLFLLVLYFPPWASGEHTPGTAVKVQVSLLPKIMDAQCAIELGERPRAIQLLKDIHENEKSYWFAQKLIGDFYAQNGAWHEAADAYRNGLKQASGADRGLLFLALGSVYESQDALEEARDLYWQGFQLVPHSRELLLRLRALAVRNQYWEEAMKWQEKIELQFPDDTEDPLETNWKIGIRYELAREACRAGTYKTSQAILKYIFRMTEYFTPAYLLQGEIQDLQQNFPSALRAYDHGFQKTQSPALLKRIGETWLRQNQPGKAIEFLREVVRATPGDPRVAFCLADLYRKLEMNADAIKVFENIRQKYPDWALSNTALADLYYRSNQSELALEIYRTVIDGAEGVSMFPWECYNCNTTYIEYAGFCMVCTMWNSTNLNQNKAGIKDFGYEKPTALPL